MKTIFYECIESLVESVIILPEEEADLILDLLQDEFKFTQFGKIDHNCKTQKKLEIKLRDISKQNKVSIQDNIYIIWDDASYPVIQIDMSTILKNIETVCSVSFDTWLYCKEKSYVIENHHEGQVSIAFT